MNKALDYAAKNGFAVESTLGTYIIRSPDRAWRWVICDCAVGIYWEPQPKPFTSQVYDSADELWDAILRSLIAWIVNMEKY